MLDNLCSKVLIQANTLKAIRKFFQNSRIQKNHSLIDLKFLFQVY